MVLNADDYYGKEAFVKLHNWLCNSNQMDVKQNDYREIGEKIPFDFCMAGFILKNTLSDNGGVTRGICKVNENGYLTEVVETSNIVKLVEKKTLEAAENIGEEKIDAAEKMWDEPIIKVTVNNIPVDVESYVSMNMWGLTPEFMEILSERFERFFAEKVPENPLKSEYLLPVLIGELLYEKKITVKVLPTQDKWFGVTYAEDKELVVKSFRELIKQGIYKEDLFSDL